MMIMCSIIYNTAAGTIVVQKQKILFYFDFDRVRSISGDELQHDLRNPISGKDFVTTYGYLLTFNFNFYFKMISIILRYSSKNIYMYILFINDP